MVFFLNGEAKEAQKAVDSNLCFQRCHKLQSKASTIVRQISLTRVVVLMDLHRKGFECQFASFLRRDIASVYRPWWQFRVSRFDSKNPHGRWRGSVWKYSLLKVELVLSLPLWQKSLSHSISRLVGKGQFPFPVVFRNGTVLFLPLPKLLLCCNEWGKCTAGT